MDYFGLFVMLLLLLKRVDKKVLALTIHPRWEKILQSDFEITIPYITDSEGHFVSHDLESLTAENTQDGSSRRTRRSVTSQNFPDTLHLHINTSHSLFPLHLQSNDNLLAESFAIYKRQPSIKNGKYARKTVIEEFDRTNLCFYKGHISNIKGSSVAISVCDGMMGYIHTGTEHYIIEPLPEEVMLVNSFHSSRHRHDNITITTTHLYSHPYLNTSSLEQQQLPATEDGAKLHYPQQTGSSGSVGLDNKISDKFHRNQISPHSWHKRQHIIYRHDGRGMENTRSFQAPHGQKKGERNPADLPSQTCAHNSEVKESDPFLYADDMATFSSQYNSDHSHRRFKRSNIHSSGTHKGSSLDRNHTKTTNSVNGEEKGRRSVETIVVVDHAMLNTHGQSNVTTYVLTLLNMVNKLFHDQTIGTKINISLVALILLEGEEPGLVLGNKADQALNNFCHWQSNLKGLHHDHAILLTGLDICSYNGQLCDTLGFAPIEGMCKRYRSCTLNEDNGLGTAFTITHEAGHNFGMRHDGDNNYCTDYSGSIMAPKLLGTSGMFKWSACSRKYLDKFLNSHQAWCLENTPMQLSSLQFPVKLPGELYDADIQCKWQFGSETKLCNYDFATDHCKALWCYTGGLKCETKFLPAAEGTSCGHSRWCRKGMCVVYGDEGPPPIDGDWSDWSPWSTCSRSCGGGVMYRQRSCSRPRPQYGGKPCAGEPRIYKLCHRHQCLLGEVDMRAEQCAYYNHRAFRSLHYTWVPYTHVYLPEDQCRLYCKAEGKQLYFEMNYKVEDGTPCLIDTDGICIDGDCMHFGCDNVVGSQAKSDMCGVCGGDNSTCEVMQGELDQQFTQNKYSYLLTLPQSARSISVKEATLSPSYFALRTTSGTYLLNGNWRISWPSQKLLAGTLFTYSRSYNKPEELTAEGPLDQDVVVEVLALRESPVVKYKYTIARVTDEIEAKELPVNNYTWSISVSHCSASCATGQRVVSAQCLKDHQEEVEEALCDVERKPLTGVETCNLQPCPPRWIAKDWSSCSKTCGGGAQRRQVMCLQTQSTNETVRVKHKKCVSQPKPERKRTCNVQECPPEWRSGRWTKCSTTCGRGKRHRQVVCRTRHQKLPQHYCSHSSQPVAMEQCEAKPCYTQVHWHLTNWSQCSASCGEGTQTRSVQCQGTSISGQLEHLSQSECSHLPQSTESLRQTCRSQVCEDAQHKRKWFVSPWSECSVTCGRGTQIRLIRCMDSMTGETLTACDSNDKPVAKQMCDRAKPCEQANEEGCVDDWKMCHLVPKHNLCHHYFYGKQCCHSCRHIQPITDPETVT